MLIRSTSNATSSAVKNFVLLIFALLTHNALAQVSVSKSTDGMRLIVDGKPFMINGMNWDFFPIGTNFSYSLWKQSDDVIKAALDSEMSLLKSMGVNTIRQYTGVQPKWIQYIYENYGIYTLLNHSFGRYGLTINGTWTPITDYSDAETRKLLIGEISKMAEDYKSTPGLLMFLLGNENNYGLFWAGAETEDFPDSEAEKQHIGETRGRPMYKLMNEAALKMKELDDAHPVALCNGDVLFIDIIAEECKDVDIYGVNMYRGVSFGNAFEEIFNKVKKPVMFTEFGADAFNAIENSEDQFSQAYYMVGNWKEIYVNAAGLGNAGNSIGGFTFQFSDGWWKFGQTKNLDVHDNNASWSNGGYGRDHIEGENNMNEEWFGICAKGPTNERGLYQLYPRAAYYALKEAHAVNPYEQGMTGESLERIFDEISLMDAVLRARGDKAALEVQKKVRLTGLRAELTTFNTGGSLLATPSEPDPTKQEYPNKRGFDFMHSYFVGVEGNPTPNMKASVNVNVLGTAAENPINEIFYENRGRPIRVSSPDGDISLSRPNTVQVYNADFAWTAKEFDVRGFYRTGHYHWGYEGDFFGLYPEANYGPNLDIYNGEVLGLELDGKQELKGLKAAFGPQLWWGANPALLLKYGGNLGKFKVTGVYHEDIDDAGAAISSFAVPVPQTRRVALHIERAFGQFGVEVGGLWAGQPLNGRIFQVTKGSPGTYEVFTDKVAAKDNWGGKIKLTYSKGPFNWYAQGAAMGLVANGGGDYTRTFTGWRLKDSGSGNQTNILTGISLNLGNVQIAPNFLWQKPIVGPMPNEVPAPGRLRNIQDDPFAVRINRETVAGELLFTFDPTPATWMYAWDNDMAEDAPFAASVGFVYRHHPTTMDAAIGFFSNRTSFAFPQSAPAQDLWEVNARLISKPSPEFGWIANIYGGTGQANGNDERLIKRFGLDLRMLHKKVKFATIFKVNDWGPFDYHRDFNLTYPLQLTFDLSTTLARPSWLSLPNTRMGIQYTWRSLDQYSPRYCPTMATANGVPVCNPLATGFDNGREWELRTYVHINIGK